MKLFKRTLSLMLVFLLFLSSVSGIIQNAAAQVNPVTVLQNEFIKVTVDNGTGRFGIRTVEGQPVRKNDHNVNMLFRGDNPETSFTTFRIDGTDYIFGNPYKFAANFFSEITKPVIVNNSNGTKQIETIWTIKGVRIKQILMLYSNKDLQNAGNVNIRYEVLNSGTSQVELGTRILLDTMVAGKDGPEFQIGTIDKQPLTVERKLVHEPEKLGIPLEDRNYHKLPAYWVMRDSLDLSNPLATNVVAYGFNNFMEKNINLVDEMIVGHWNGLANTKWDYTVNPNLDFTRDTNDYGSADSAVAFYWLPKKVAARGTQSFETVYGLGQIIEPDKIFSIRYMDPVQQLPTLEDNSAYVNEGIFDIVAEIENLAMFGMEHDEIEAQLTLGSGLDFVQLDAQGNIVRDNTGKARTLPYRDFTLQRKKSATPEEAELGIKPKYKPGDTVTVSYKVKARGKPWPTTAEYMLRVSSPQTKAKLEGVKDEEVKAQYSSVKSGFVLLPAVGKAASTYIYALSPKELYSTDIKYITVNLSNIGAYNTGNDGLEPNFDLYLREAKTGKRYKVPVKSSVVLQPTDDGFTGDMRITYRGGDEVNNKGEVVKANVGPELPIGSYQVQLDYKGDTEGDAETAAFYDITSTQTFSVTNNQASRIREANIVAVYKQLVDLSHASIHTTAAQLKDLNDNFPGKPFATGTDLYNSVIAYKETKQYVGIASKAADPKFNLSEFLDNDAMKKTPAYNYKLFSSEKELQEFFATEDAEDDRRELLVTIRGMVKEVGTGNDKQVVVDTKTEPAIINGAVAYRGKDMVFVRGKLDIFDSSKKVRNYNNMPFFDTLFVKGDGTLSVANSGFVFHKGEWTLDFYNGFNKTLGKTAKLDNNTIPDDSNPEDNTLNGSVKWAMGALGDRLNPLRALMIEDIYFNKHSLFVTPSFSVAGFGFSFNDFILRKGGVSFGGTLSMKIIEAEAKNVIFNEKGFVGVDAALRFKLDKDLGLIGKKDDPKGASGEIKVTHYVQKVEGVNNYYGIKFQADLKKMVEIKAELAFKQVDDGRILPDVIAFGTTLGYPGVVITAGTYLTGVRGAVRELADTIAGGTAKDPFPLVIQAGISMRFGEAPAFFFGDLDLTVKRTGLAILGKMDYSPNPKAGKDDLNKMITKALLETQWTTPWFVRVQAEVDILGWGVIIGKAGIFVGQNLEKKRTDFEGYIGASVQIPDSVPIVGGLPLAGVFFGVNNDKIWGSVSVLFISLGLTYYWGGGISFGTSGEGLPDGLIHLMVEDPQNGPKLLVIGQGIQTLATSWHHPEQVNPGLKYRSLGNGMTSVESDSLSVGMGGINVKNGGRVHEIPVSGITGNALIEMEYTDAVMPSFTLKNSNGATYPIVFDNSNTNPFANAFTQFVPAAKSPDGVDVRKAYVIIPKEKLAGGGVWTLSAVQPVETRIMNVPTTPKLNDIQLTKTNDPNQFKASWAVENAKPGDTISLYLTEDAVPTITTGKAAPEAGEPGLLIAKDLAVARNGGVTGNITKGEYLIDVTQVSLLGDIEDIRGLLRQGNYYLRAEYKSEAAFGTKTSKERFELINPLAPANVSEVKVEPAGNGLFSLSFKPGAKKSIYGDDVEHSFLIEAMQEEKGKKVPYLPFSELLFTEEELQPYWNEEKGIYENILIGGWTRVDTEAPELVDGVMDLKEDETKEKKYIGLEIGKEYIIGVTAMTQPPKEMDKNENYHYASRVDSTRELLPIPVLPKLSVGQLNNLKFQEAVTNKTSQEIDLVSDQRDIEVEAIHDGVSLGKVELANRINGSQGSIKFNFDTDGHYAIELLARNKKTKDVAVTMLYLTVDTLPPVLYLDEPITGDRTENGQIRVSGTTTKGATLKVNGTVLEVQEDGRFSGSVRVNSTEPTVNLNITAHDEAGNSNEAVVEVTNDQFEVPVALVLRKLDTLLPGQNTLVQPLLRYPDGIDADGKPKFKEVPVPEADMDKVHVELTNGEAVVLTEVTRSGKTQGWRVSGVTTGSSVLQAEYQVTGDVKLKSVMVASVAVPAPTNMGSISVATQGIIGDNTKTRVTYSNEGDMLGYQMVYKLFRGQAEAATVPTFHEDLSSWSLLPASGALEVRSGDRLVVAKRTSGTKQAVAASSVHSVTIWTLTGGGFGFGGFGGGFGFGLGVQPDTVNRELTANGQPITAEANGDQLTAVITAKDLETSGTNMVIRTDDKSIKQYSLRFDTTVQAYAIKNRKNLVLELPSAKLVITPDMLLGLRGELNIQITPNNEPAVTQTSKLVSSLGGVSLGAGQGVTIETNLPMNGSNKYMLTKVPVPAGVSVNEITAVILSTPDGKWTPVPWKLDMVQNEAFANVSLTGNGSISFVYSSKSFSDVTPAYWGKSAIQEASSKLFLMGRSQDRFDPESQVTRAEYPTLLLRAAGLMNKTASSSFKDVDEKAWYYSSVSAAAELGVVNGKEDGSFQPHTSLNRLEGMVMAGRLIEAVGFQEGLTDEEVDRILGTFKDSEEIPLWARRPVALTIKHGIIVGENQRINPQLTLKRVQAAAIVNRVDRLLLKNQ